MSFPTVALPLCLGLASRRRGPNNGTSRDRGGRIRDHWLGSWHACAAVVFGYQQIKLSLCKSLSDIWDVCTGVRASRSTQKPILLLIGGFLVHWRFKCCPGLGHQIAQFNAGAVLCEVMSINGLSHSLPWRAGDGLRIRPYG